MNKLRCLIIDDEPLSQDVLEKYILDVPGLQLTGICSDALDAMEILQHQQVDLMFLDINMPKLSGINFARSLEHSPMIIFTTAYPEYAVEGFELDAVDYLVKPISFDRFIKGINKAREYWQMRNSKNLKTDIDEVRQYITVKSNKKIYKVDIPDIQYIQSYGDYIKICTSKKMILTSETMKNIQEVLKDPFVRVHKSFLVNITSILYVEGNLIKIGEVLIPVGLKYKEDFFKKFRGNH
jgi:DNA-binding LytR/AlgR family response regulator